MQAQMLRTRALSRATTPFLRTSRAGLIPRRSATTDAPKPGEASGNEMPGALSMRKNNYPLYALLAFIVGFPSFYFYNSSRKANGGRRDIDEIRKTKGTAGEYRDARDSPIKTLDDKKRKDARIAKESS